MRFRSLLVGVVCAAMCIGICGCFDTPLGDPQKSQIDPNLEGFYTFSDKNGTQMAELAPFDDHTYLIQLFQYHTDTDGAHVDGFAAMKAWLTTIKGVTFITIAVPDPMDLFKPADQRKANYIIATLTVKDHDIELHPLSDAIFSKDKTPQELAQAVTNNIGKPEMYDSTNTELWARMDDQAKVQAILKAANPP